MHGTKVALRRLEQEAEAIAARLKTGTMTLCQKNQPRNKPPLPRQTGGSSTAQAMGSTFRQKLRVGACNVNGIAGKLPEIQHQMKTKKLAFLFVSETWACVSSMPPPEGNFLYWSPVQERTNTGHAPYGVALMIGDNVHRRAVRILGGAPGHTIWWCHEGIVYRGIYLRPDSTLEEITPLLTPNGWDGAETDTVLNWRL
jgi:hypothetical protein